MTPSPRANQRPRFDRMVDWLLDTDGDIYGDERAHLRWYEGIAVTASVQWILVLWVLAVCAWTAPVSASPALWSIAVAFVVPMYLSLIYAARRGVEVAKQSRSRKAKLVQIGTLVPMFVFLVGMTVGLDLRSGRTWSEMSSAVQGGIVGGVIGLVGAAAVIWYLRRRMERRIATTGESDLD